MELIGGFEEVEGKETAFRCTAARWRRAPRNHGMVLQG